MSYEKTLEALEYIKGITTSEPNIGIILGSGLGNLVNSMKNKEEISYRDIPYFPLSKVQGHEGKLVFGDLGTQKVVAMQGRFHYYEGFSMKELTFPVFVLKMLGVENLLVTNACGGINKAYQPGDIVLISDYINMFASNPLIGENDERFGVRFPDMSEPYARALREKAAEIAKELGIDCQEGVYALFSGPCYETAAEIRAYAALGADCIGMSTVPETIVANYLGMRVLGIACITNMATGIAKERHTHEEVLRIANLSSEKLCRLVQSILEKW